MALNQYIILCIGTVASSLSSSADSLSSVTRLLALRGFCKLPQNQPHGMSMQREHNVDCLPGSGVRFVVQPGREGTHANQEIRFRHLSFLQLGCVNLRD
jgi:hypothetical protein